MSGTSTDGVDLCYARFTNHDQDGWKYHIAAAKSYDYPEQLRKTLLEVVDASAEEIYHLDIQLAKTFAECIHEFIDAFQLNPEEIDAIASHGHTVFHQPEKGLTVQIGCGATLAQRTGIDVINDFRTKDVTLGGQGAPLVPIGDKLLLKDQADAFLNIGGFANICIPKSPIVAFDTCPGNLPMNWICENQWNIQFDKDGEKAKFGTVNEKALNQLNNLPYYRESGPKSLGVEWLKSEFWPIVRGLDPSDGLRTIIAHISDQISQIVSKYDVKKLMISGGGGKNGFLMNEIAKKSACEIVLPDDVMIEFKEALIFGFLGALFLADHVNVLSEVTGAQKDSKSGILHKA